MNWTLGGAGHFPWQSGLIEDRALMMWGTAVSECGLPQRGASESDERSFAARCGHPLQRKREHPREQLVRRADAEPVKP
jgi:hypothetical protein